MVSDSVLWIIVGPYFLTSVHCANLGLSSPGLGFDCFLILRLEKPLFKNLGGSFPVLVLTSLFLNKHAETCWDMSGSTSGICLLDRLTACAAWPCVLIFYVLIVNDESEWDRRHNYHGDCRWMESSFALCFRDSNDFMHTRLTLHDFVAILTTYFKFKVLVPLWCYCFFYLTDILDSPPLRFGIGHEHFANVFYEYGRLRSTSTCSEFQIDLLDIIVCIRRYEQFDGGLFELLSFLF